jgi:hypothetical protein
LKKTAQKTNAKSKSHAEMCPSKLRRGALTIPTLLSLLSSSPSTKENGRAACNEVNWDERQPHACKLSQFFVTQLFTEWFAIHAHIMWFHDVSHFAKLKHSDGEAARAPR